MELTNILIVFNGSAANHVLFSAFLSTIYIDIVSRMNRNIYSPLGSSDICLVSAFCLLVTDLRCWINGI